MAYKIKRKLLIGSEANYTFFGLIGSSHGVSYGGYNNYIYGIKGFFNIQIYKGWGECANYKL